MTFVVSEFVAGSRALEDPLAGSIYASIFRAADVQVTGPVEGAEALAHVRVDDADLSDGKRSIPFITGDLPTVPVQVLGFFDVDGNAVEGDEDPETGDPVTVPFTKFQALEGLTSEITVSFDLLMR